MNPKEIIESIRREEYMLDVDGSESDRPGIRNLHRKLGNALKLLAEDLYSSKEHFLLELIQNADDNKYHQNVIPALKIEVKPDQLLVSNNEIGFHEETTTVVMCSTRFDWGSIRR